MLPPDSRGAATPGSPGRCAHRGYSRSSLAPGHRGVTVTAAVTRGWALDAKDTAVSRWSRLGTFMSGVPPFARAQASIYLPPTPLCTGTWETPTSSGSPVPAILLPQPSPVAPPPPAQPTGAPGPQGLPAPSLPHSRPPVTLAQGPCSHGSGLWVSVPPQTSLQRHPCSLQPLPDAPRPLCRPTRHKGEGLPARPSACGAPACLTFAGVCRPANTCPMTEWVDV